MKYIFLFAFAAIALGNIPGRGVVGASVNHGNGGSLSLWERVGERACARQASHPPLAPPKGRGRNHAAESYAKYCASCHGRDGRAKTVKARLNHARNIADSEWQGRVSDERIFNSVMNGKGKMPGYGKKLSEQEIDALVSYIRGLKK